MGGPSEPMRSVTAPEKSATWTSRPMRATHPHRSLIDARPPILPPSAKPTTSPMTRAYRMNTGSGEQRRRGSRQDTTELANRDGLGEEVPLSEFAAELTQPLQLA